MTSKTRLTQANSALQEKESLALARSGWEKPDELLHEDDKRFVVDPEFEALIPPLTMEERDALEASLLAEGCRDALVVWKTEDKPILIDGHNRYRLCRRHGLPFNTIERAFANREDVVMWMVRNQLSRRNLTDFSRVEIVKNMTAVIDALKAKAKANESVGGKVGADMTNRGLTNLSNPVNPINTRAELAALAGVSEGTFNTVDRTLRDGPEFVKALGRSGAISPYRTQEMTKALKGADPEVVEVVERYGVEDPQTIVLMTHLHHEKRDSWDEIKSSGHIQITDDTDAVPITAPSVLLYKAIEKKAGEHRHIGGQASAEKRGVPVALQASENNEWYTPGVYLEAVRAVLGSVDIDPASNAEANEIVQAATFYDIHDDGLSHDWTGTVFLNPPYGRDGISNQERWSHRLMEQYAAGITTEAILLVNAVTERVWFQPLWDYPICFTDHRIPFYRPGGVPGQPVIGSAFVYFGKNPDRFAAVFRKFGAVVLRVVRGDDDGSSAE